MNKPINGAVEQLLQKLRVRKVKWTGGGQLFVGLVSGPHSWGQLKQISNEEFVALSARIRQVALDTGAGVLDCWWDVQSDCGAGFAAPEGEQKEERWVFAFQVKAPPGKQEQTWTAPRRVVFRLDNGRQLTIRGFEP